MVTFPIHTRTQLYRASYVRQKFHNIKGGKQRADFLRSLWAFEVLPEELSAQALERKKLILERKLECLADENKVLEEKVQNFGNSGKKRKSLDSCSESHKRLLKRKRTTSCETSLEWLELEGFIPTRLELRNVESGESHTLILNKKMCCDLFGQAGSEASQDDIDIVNMMKDKYNVSGQAYHEMRKACKQMPTHYKVKKRIAELNTMWKIRPTPNGTVGVQQSLEDRLRPRILRLLKESPPNASFRTSKTIRVKLSGDGTWIGKRLHVLNITFTVLDEGVLAYSSEGNHTLALLKEPEKYEFLQRGLEDLRNEVERLTEIVVDGETYQIDYYLGGDWKYLACITGIDSARSQFACIWCKCSMTDRADVEKKWSISDRSLGARTIEENIALSKLPKSKKAYNVSNPPLFSSIPLTKVVIEELSKVHAITCLNCSQTGHNFLSCTQLCKLCGHSNYKQHLTTVEGTKIPLCNK